MEESRNQYQIIRKDNKNCFVESLSDAFEISADDTKSGIFAGGT